MLREMDPGENVLSFVPSLKSDKPEPAIPGKSARISRDDQI